MIHVCAWCKKVLGSENSDEKTDRTITHGICRECADKFKYPQEIPFKHFLDKLSVPILAVNNEGIVVTANEEVCSLLGKNLFQIEGNPGGNVIECVNARLPGGCGKQIHCKSCTIRNTVMHTHATGQSHLKVKAYPDIQMDDMVKTLSVEISTEKIGDVVLLRIDEMNMS